MPTDQPTPTDTTEPPDQAVAVLAQLTSLGEHRAQLTAQLAEVEREARDLVLAHVQVEMRRDPTRPVTQVAAAASYGINLTTVRDWLGLRRRTREAPRRSDFGP